jgi:alpha-glucosidase (family GH31 glycosyl hydrolase)
VKLSVLWLAAVACGDNAVTPLPPTLTAGPVTITTSTMTLAVGDLTLERFLSIGVVDEIEEIHYYDPRGDAQVETVAIDEAKRVDDDWIVLANDVRLRLARCEGVESCAVLEVDASRTAGAVQLSLSLPHVGGEPAYGTGDAAGGANIAGAKREMQLRVDDKSESSLNETHVPVPVVLWPRRGIGWFIADDRPAAYDLSAVDRSTATFTLPVRGTFKSYIYRAADPLDLVRTYTALTTKPAVPPRWALAPQQWRNVWNSAAEVRDDANEMRTRRIPGSVMWIDNPWQTAYNTFVVDETRLAAPQQLIADLNAQGYHVVFWSTPYVGTTPATAADRMEGAASKFFITDDTGRTIDYPWQNGPGALVDFTRDGASAWWGERIKRVVDIGARGFKLDFGEEVVPDIAGTILPMLLAKGDNSSHHARYAEGYHEAYLRSLPPGDGFLITRAGTWGEQHTNTCIWPGDLDSDLTAFGVDNGAGKTNVGGLPSAISRGLSLSMSGYPFYGSDIGGFRGFPTTETLLRWAAYAAYGTVMQLGGGGKSHNPWDTTLFDAGSDVVYKKFADLHMQLNPLLWTLARKAGDDGTPITRPAAFMYDCDCDDTMFFLGDNLLVAPVTTPGATTRDVVLPPGHWVDRNTGELVQGDGTRAITVPAPRDVIPTWQKSGSFVPMFARYADTLLPATAAGVTSYTDPTLARELRLVYTPGGSFEDLVELELHDGARASASMAFIDVTAGTQYSVFTLDIDARHQPLPFSAPTMVSIFEVGVLPSVADVTTCAAPGCWHFDAATKRLEVRVFAIGTTHVAIE